jgi:hypothetical protein
MIDIQTNISNTDLIIGGLIMAPQKKRSVIVCGHCGIEFEVPKCRERLAKFCSPSCKYSHRESVKSIEKECKMCGKKFKTYPSHDNDYCSYECYHVSCRKQIEKKCENCGKIFSVKLSQDLVQCCSLKCKYELAKKFHSTDKYNGAYWREVKEIILKRDKNTCYFCKRTMKKGLDVHHKKPRKNGGTDEYENLVALCKSCHIKLHRIIS